MRPAKILLFGCTGQVGWELQRSLAPLGEVVALHRASAGPLVGNFQDIEGVTRTVRDVRPEVVVNAAAYTSVDKAESEPDHAMRINAVAPASLAAAAAEIGAWFVHYSTDYVFDGRGTRPWKEDDTLRPLNVYGRTKLEGERGVRSSNPRHLILRTSWVYAARGANFAKTMLRLARERDKLAVVDDQFGAPTGADLLADVTAHALRGLTDGRGEAGTYHVAASGETTWHGYASFVLQTAQHCGEILKAGPPQVLRVPTSEFPTPARRPQNSRLDTSRLRDAFDIALPQWEHGVTRMMKELLPTAAT